MTREEDDLIEQLARRLAIILANHEGLLSDGFTYYGGRGDDSIKIETTDSLTWVPLEPCRDLARECLRQIDWNMGRLMANVAGIKDDPPIVFSPFERTLAPPEWTP